MSCNCGKIRHEYTAEYLEKKAKEKILKELARKEKEKNNGGNVKEQLEDPQR